MLALLSTLAFAAAATFAIAAVFVTMKGRRGQIASLLADYRSVQHDREFLAYVTGVPPLAPRMVNDPQLRRIARRALKRSEAARSAHSLRAAA